MAVGLGNSQFMIFFIVGVITINFSCLSYVNHIKYTMKGYV